MTRVRVHPDVERALARGGPVVALESTVITHGLPSPTNLELAADLERIVAAAGATPATIAVVTGEVHIGLDPATLTRLCADTPSKLSTRDLAPALATGGSGGTTVAATAHLAARAGIRVFATGGIGGVHRGAVDSWDVSADLDCLAHTPIAVVCAGVKSLLDIGATLERLESLGVPVLGYRRAEFPGFYLPDTGHRVDWVLDSPARAAAVLRAHWDLGLPGGVLITNAVPADAALDAEAHERALQGALAAAAGVRGKDVTPVMLEHFHATTGGASLAANLALLRSNAELAAQIAVALAG
jgi:pseudouridine-5'-phosphate glycosidase